MKEICKFEKGRNITHAKVFYNEWIKIKDNDCLLDIINNYLITEKIDKPLIDSINYIFMYTSSKNVDSIIINAKNKENKCELNIKIPFDKFVSLFDDKLNEIAFDDDEINNKELSVVDIAWDCVDESLIFFYTIYEIENIKIKFDKSDFIKKIQELPSFIEKYRVLDFYKIDDDIICKVIGLNNDIKLNILLDKDDLKYIMKKLLIDKGYFSKDDKFKINIINYPSLSILKSIDKKIIV